MEAVRVSIVIPVFNGGTDLPRCLDAIASLSYPVHECILVDDASTDGVTEQVAQSHGARIIRLQEQGGPANARNRGVEAASGDLIFFVDADVLVHTDTLGIAVNVLEARPDTAAVFGSYDDEPGHPSFLSQYRNLLHHWVHQTSPAQASTFWTGCGMIRREVFLEMGGFKTTYQRPSIEDIELGSRIYRSGYEIRLEKSMLCKHLKQWTFWNMVKTDVFFRGTPWAVLLLENRDAPKDLNLSFKARLATLLAGTLALCAVILPISGHAGALGPAAAFLLAATGCIFLAGKKAGNALVTTVLPLSALAAYQLYPDPLAIIPMGLILLLIGTNLAFYRYLAEKRSSAFAVGVIPFQVVFFLGCAVAGVLGIFQHYFGTTRK
jgi:GT2 family glycosyltransferase